MANRVTLVVEGPTDLGIITALLLHARIPLDDLLVVAAGGREGLLLAQSLRRPGDQLGVLVDADGRDPGEVRVQLELGLGAADVTVFVAVHLDSARSTDGSVRSRRSRQEPLARHHRWPAP